MTSKYETSIYTRKQLDSARQKAQVIGWVQGAGSMFLLLMLLNFIGWIPAILLTGLAGFIGFKFFSRRSSASEESA